MGAIQTAGRLARSSARTHLMAVYFVGLMVGGVMARAEDHGSWLICSALILGGAVAVATIDTWWREWAYQASRKGWKSHEPQYKP